MLAQARRFTLLALAASLFALTAAAPASAQGDPNDSDYDKDGVLDRNDACPLEAGSAANGCEGDKDGDGVLDKSDRCPDESSGGYAGLNPGCPKPPGPDDHPDTPAADGPSCTKKQRCMVFEQKGLGLKPNGSYKDPNAVMTVTVARDAEGFPARVVSMELSGIDTACHTPDPYTESGYASTAGPEVSATLDALALKKTREGYQFDPEAPVRTINGLKYELNFYMDEGEGGMQDALFEVKGAPADKETGKCIANVATRLSRGVSPAGAEIVDMRLSELLKTGRQGFACGHAKKPSIGRRTEIDCRIEAKLTVPKKVAQWLGLDSPVLAKGVAGDMVEHYKHDGRPYGRTYFLKIPNISKLRAKLKKKNVISLGGSVDGSITVRDAREVDCESDGEDPYELECPLEGADWDGDRKDREFSWHAYNAKACTVFDDEYLVAVAPRRNGKCPRGTSPGSRFGGFR